MSADGFTCDNALGSRWGPVRNRRLELSSSSDSTVPRFSKLEEPPSPGATDPRRDHIIPGVAREASNETWWVRLRLNCRFVERGKPTPCTRRNMAIRSDLPPATTSPLQRLRTSSNCIKLVNLAISLCALVLKADNPRFQTASVRAAHDRKHRGGPIAAQPRSRPCQRDFPQCSGRHARRAGEVLRSPGLQQSTTVNRRGSRQSSGYGSRQG